MKRADWLIPFSHDHQHGLAQSLRLRNAARDDDADQLARRVADALSFADGELAAHMAAEESALLPLLVQLDLVEPAGAARMAAEHLELRVLRDRLRARPDDAARALEFAQALHDHIRWEERHLFERAQEQAAGRDGSAVEQALAGLATPDPVAIAQPRSSPGASGLALGALNATNVVLAPGQRIESASIDRDVAYVVVDGDGTLVAGAEGGDRIEPLEAGRTIALARGTRRTIEAGSSGLRLTTVHVRRGGIELEPVGRA